MNKQLTYATDGTRLVQFGMRFEHSSAAYSKYVSSGAQKLAQNVQACVISTNRNELK